MNEFGYDAQPVYNATSRVDVNIRRYNKDMGETPFPTYGTPSSAGMDIYSAEDVTIRPGEMVPVRTNFATEIPEGYVALVFARSGLAIKHRIGLANSVAVIDSDYRGEWIIPLVNENPIKGKYSRMFNNILNKFLKRPNTDETVYDVKVGDRIAQVIFMPYPVATLHETKELSDSSRGTGGFGSTGV